MLQLCISSPLLSLASLASSLPSLPLTKRDCSSAFSYLVTCSTSFILLLLPPTTPQSASVLQALSLSFTPTLDKLRLPRPHTWPLHP